MPTSSGRVSRLHSKDPADAAWRARQAHVDADIEGLSRDAGADKLGTFAVAAVLVPAPTPAPSAPTPTADPMATTSKTTNKKNQRISRFVIAIS